MAEARSSRRELRGAFYRQFWNQTIESSRSLDTVVRCMPNEASPGPLTSPSGLSRAQQLLVASALGVPLAPTFSKEHGGVCLDRAVPLLGCRWFWTALLFRFKLQKYLEERQNMAPWLRQVEALGNPQNFRACCKGRLDLGKHISITGKVESNSVKDIHEAIQWRPPPQGSSTAGPNGRGRWDGFSARTDLRMQLRGHRISASRAYQDEFRCKGGYARVPGLLSVEVASDKGMEAMHYRIGVHQVEGHPVYAGGTADDAPVEGYTPGTYLQGGLAFDGEATLLPRKRHIHRWHNKARTARVGDTLTLLRRQQGDPLLQFDKGDAGGTSLPDSQQKASSDEILENMRMRTQKVKTLSTDARGWASKVRHGKLKEMLGLQAKDKGRRPKKQTPWPFLSNAHLRVCGLIGLAASMRISGFSGMRSRPSFSEPSPSTSTVRRWSPRPWANERFAHLFLATGISLQAGQMQNWLLSYSSVSARFEVQVPAPWGAYQRLRRSQSFRGRRTAWVAGAGTPPGVQVSVAQQVLGPLRAKADFRWVLEAGDPVVRPGGGPLIRAQDHIRSLRSHLAEAQYGFDFAAPGLAGAFRIGGWYTPARKEGLIEMRMF
ncbi:unnamed protein product [Ostreobium quekettii]|uniref:Uncharacterized protein n=1 Tax=Ostreobium quekettii TaxID=121088 RepID=A0A8S1JJ09_9CHLO|nr:unnamed protein product [Ostreobium quekettii]|eukprot:evm.model.scf_143.1 EVM.evm.TU.scf_143.1   scf_143:13739-25068(+)